MTLWSSSRFRFWLLACGAALMLIVGIGLATPAGAAKPAAGSPQEKGTNAYCLGCHGQQGLTKTMPSGEVLSLYINPELFNHGVHNQENVACTDCHKGISTFTHPALSVDTVRDMTLQLYPTCKDCHADQYNKVLDSVHQKALAAGNFNAAVCTDCHNQHQQTRMTDPQSGKLPSSRLAARNVTMRRMRSSSTHSLSS